MDMPNSNDSEFGEDIQLQHVRIAMWIRPYHHGNVTDERLTKLKSKIRQMEVIQKDIRIPIRDSALYKQSQEVLHRQTLLTHPKPLQRIILSTNNSSSVLRICSQATDMLRTCNVYSFRNIAHGFALSKNLPHVNDINAMGSANSFGDAIQAIALANEVML